MIWPGSQAHCQLSIYVDNGVSMLLYIHAIKVVGSKIITEGKLEIKLGEKEERERGREGVREREFYLLEKDVE